MQSVGISDHIVAIRTPAGVSHSNFKNPKLLQLEKKPYLNVDMFSGIVRLVSVRQLKNAAAPIFLSLQAIQWF